MTTGKTADSWGSPEGVKALRVETTAYYTVQPPAQPLQDSTPVLIALHGWGQSSRSFLRRMAALKEAGILVIAPQGPHQTYLDWETRKIGFSWLTAYDRPRAIPDLVGLLNAVIQDVAQDYGLRGPRFLLGFSQGVSIAYRYALRSATPISGVIACGGDLPEDVREGMAGPPAFPVLLVHGDDDDIVPAAKCEVAERALETLGWPVEAHRFAGGHVIPTAVVETIGDWIHRQAGSAL